MVSCCTHWENTRCCHAFILLYGTKSIKLIRKKGKKVCERYARRMFVASVELFYSGKRPRFSLRIIQRLTSDWWAAVCVRAQANTQCSTESSINYNCLQRNRTQQKTKIFFLFFWFALHRIIPYISIINFTNNATNAFGLFFYRKTLTKKAEHSQKKV